MAPEVVWNRPASTREQGNRAENWSAAGRGTANASTLPARSSSNPAGTVSTLVNSARFSVLLKTISSTLFRVTAM
jgi:hypothetical protein